MSKNILKSAASSSAQAWLGQELCDTPLWKLTTWHIGGPAERLYYPISLLDLSLYLKALSTEVAPTMVTWLGLGSNVLIRDQGLKGVVIVTKYLNELNLIAPNCVYAQAGVTCAKLARFCAKHNLSGAEFFAGIPGTVGGALAMNAGAFGGETWSLVQAVEMMDTAGEMRTRSSSEFNVSYRTVSGRVPSQLPEGFVGAIFQCPSSLPGINGQAKIKTLLQERNAKQPIGTYNCGSVFRNPAGFHAAQLIEDCDLKGTRIGGAVVSLKHANFILNDQEAKSVEVEQLIQLIQSTVFEKFSVHLVPEVKILGTNGLSIQSNVLSPSIHLLGHNKYD